MNERPDKIRANCSQGLKLQESASDRLPTNKTELQIQPKPAAVSFGNLKF